MRVGTSGVPMHPLHNLTLFVGRILIAGLFIFDAIVMVRSWDANAAYMESFGIPGVLLPAAALCQLVGGIMIVFGFWTRLVALAFAAFCVATAFIFHRNLANTGEIVQAGKDLAIAGGFLFLSSTGPGAWSLDRVNQRLPR